MKRLVWADDGVLSIRLRDDLFTLAQMREGAYLQFFDIRSCNDDWRGIDLNQIGSLFFVLVANSTRDLYERRLAKGSYLPSIEPLPSLMLDAVTSRLHWKDGQPSKGFHLVRLGPDSDPVSSEIVKPNLTVGEDLNLLHGHETTGMKVDAGALRDRLLRYFDTGVDFDDLKWLQVPDLPLPEPRRNPAAIPWYP